MLKLRDTNIAAKGDLLAQVPLFLKTFGDIEWDGSVPHNSFFLVAVCENRYTCSETAGTMFILAPDCNVDHVWPEKDKRYRVRYGQGRAKVGASSFKVVPALYIERKGHALYFCLTPDGRQMHGDDTMGV